ncbi:MAG: LysR substrate-binding domain-containing protein [Pseudomonadota bacterium]
MRRLPPTNALEAFLATARSGTLRSASNELNLSTSALSRRIQNLETHVGRPLFEREHHQFRLTVAGERLLAEMEPAFDRLGLILEELRDEKQYQISVGVPPSFATAWLMPRLHKFRSQHPEVELHLDSSGSPIAKLGLSLDAIIFFAEKDEHPFEMRELRPQRVFAVALPGLVDIRLGVKQVLHDHPLLLHRALPKLLPSWLDTIGLDDLPANNIEYYDDGPLILSAAENGLGIALVLEDMVNFSTSTSRLIRPFGECGMSAYSYYLATKPATGSNRALNWFRDWLLEEVESDNLIMVRNTEYG